jgi:hypothetical protein
VRDWAAAEAKLRAIGASSKDETVHGRSWTTASRAISTAATTDGLAGLAGTSKDMSLDKLAHFPRDAYVEHHSAETLAQCFRFSCQALEKHWQACSPTFLCYRTESG